MNSIRGMAFAIPALVLGASAVSASAQAQSYYARQKMSGENPSTPVGPPPPEPFACGEFFQASGYLAGSAPAGETRVSVSLGMLDESPAGYATALQRCQATPTVGGFKTRQCHLNVFMETISVFATNEVPNGTVHGDAARHVYATCSGG